MVVEKKKVGFTPKQMEAFKYLQLDDETEIVLYGGQAGSGKSYFGCVWMILECLKVIGLQAVIARKTFTDLKKHTIKTFKVAAKDLGLIEGIDYKINLGQGNNMIQFFNPDYNKYNSKERDRFKDGSNITLKDIAYRPSDPEGVFFGGNEYAIGMIDELPEIHKDYFDLLFSRLGRQEKIYKGVKLYCTCNPSNGWIKDFFYKRSLEGILPKEYKFVNTVGDNNKHRKQRYINQLARMSEKQYKKLNLGDWDYEDCPDELFNNNKIEEIMSGLTYGIDEKFISIDIGGQGKDYTVICVWKGFTCIDVIKYQEPDHNILYENIMKIQNLYKIPRNKVIADFIGIGHGIADRLGCIKFTANAKPFKDERYDMMKSQLFFTMVATNFSVSTDVKAEYREQIIKELRAVRDKSNDYKMKVNSKDLQKAILGGKSPDFVDALMMRFYFMFMREKITIHSF